MRLIAHLVITAVAGMIGSGLFGAWRYVAQYNAYRGFGAPVDTTPLPDRGTLVPVVVRSPALAGRPVTVEVYLPAAYAADPQRRFPTMYFLQGMPGTAETAYLDVLHLVPRLNQLMAAGVLRPMIAVVPPGTFSAHMQGTEWADSPKAGQEWFTYLTRDVVGAVDARFRTIRSPAARGVAGYSAGADAALNAVILRPDLFGIAEPWSGDFHQDPRYVGGNKALVRRFTALDTVGSAARTLAVRHAHIWLVVGADDSTVAANRRVAAVLRRAHVDVTLTVIPRLGHAWKLWSAGFQQGLRYFSRELA
jgi:enterochelin esterase-like enzyme